MHRRFSRPQGGPEVVGAPHEVVLRRADPVPGTGKHAGAGAANESRPRRRPVASRRERGLSVR
ncbi:hypothetical protein L083_2618 [Actinoplanes sp. N902-109]|nr:hypothetical protein L083_2618 [Actinoplanes sp. N902-109]